jgi:predicted PurR-regulated permease PerM
MSTYSDQFSQRQAEFTAQMQRLSGTIDDSQLTSAVDPAALSRALSFIVSSAANIFKSGLLILVATMFVLAESQQFIKRMGQAFGADHFLPKNVTELAHMMISYFGLRAIVNAVTAGATGLMLWLFGIEYAGLWRPAACRPCL